MKVRFSPSRDSEFVKPKLEEDSTPVSLADLIGFSVEPPAEANIIRRNDTSYDWRDWTLNLGLEDIKAITNTLNTFLIGLQDATIFIAQVARTLRLFSNDLKSLTRLFKVVLNRVSKSIRGFIESLESTPLSVTLIVPDVDKRKPGFINPINFGFSEFKTRVSNACLDPNDPNAPKFEPPDKVGGWVIAGIAGQNDPDALFDLFKNFDILSKFFRFNNPNLSPPENVTLKSGNYGGEDKHGVKITWNHPGTQGIHAFAIYRCRYYAGYLKTVEFNGEPVSINIYKDEEFNNNQPVIVNALLARPNYSYIDYEVENGEKYHYVVYSLPIKDFLEKEPVLQSLKSPLASNRVSITFMTCIPTSKLYGFLSPLLIDIDGNPVDPDFLRSEWLSFNVRSLLGLQFEGALRRLEKFFDVLDGWATTGSDAIGRYLDFYSNRIRQYTQITRSLQEIIQTINQYRFGGSVLYLNLELESGGIDGFVKRFNEATINPEVLELNGIFFGVVLVYGFPKFGGRSFGLYFSEQEQEQYNRRIEQSQTAIKFMSEAFFGGD